MFNNFTPKSNDTRCGAYIKCVCIPYLLYAYRINIILKNDIHISGVTRLMIQTVNTFKYVQHFINRKKVKKVILISTKIIEARVTNFFSILIFLVDNVLMGKF